MIKQLTSIPMFLIRFIIKIIKSGLNERNLFTFILNYFINFLPVSIWLAIFKNAGLIPNEIRPKIYVKLIYELDLSIFALNFRNLFVWTLITLGFSYIWLTLCKKISFYYNLNVDNNNTSILPKLYPDEEQQAYEFENFQDLDDSTTTNTSSTSSSSSTDSDSSSTFISNSQNSSLSISTTKITRTHSLYLVPILFFSVWPMLNIAEHFAKEITVPKDLTAWFFYVLGHITFPILTAVYLYVFQPPGILKCFSIALGLQNIAGVMTHLLFPNAPPWFIHLYGPDSDANYDMPGYAAGLTRIDVTLGTHLHSQGFHKSPIVFGAFPSLHSAMAVQVFFFIFYFANIRILRIAALLFVYIQWWGTIYLDHHFKIDLIAGWAYAITSFAIVYPFLRRKELQFIKARLNSNFAKGTTMGMRVFDRNFKIQKFFDPYK